MCNQRLGSFINGGSNLGKREPIFVNKPRAYLKLKVYKTLTKCIDNLINKLPEMSLMELCLAHDKEMRWGYLSRRDYVFVEISRELKQRGEDPLLCRKTSEHNH